MDVGLQTVERIREIMLIDREWMVEEPRGFSWWGSTRRQSVVADPVVVQHGDELSRVVVRTEMLQGVREGAATTAALSEMNSSTSGGAFRIDAGSLIHEAGASVGVDGVDWLSRTASFFATIALTSGVRLAESFSAQHSGAAWISPHPTTGLRTTPDEVLDVPHAVIMPMGAGPSAWADEQPRYAAAAQMINSIGGFAADVSGAEGLAGELPFGNAGTSFLIVRPTKDGPPRMPETLSTPPDPEFGHGLVARLVLPLSLTPEGASAMAADLNAFEMEAWTAADQPPPVHFGAWHAWDLHVKPTPAYRVFFPNLLARLVDPLNIAVHMIVRAQRVSGRFGATVS